MNVSVMKECPDQEVMLAKAHERFIRDVEAAAAGEPIGFEAADNDGNHVLRVVIIDDHRVSADTLSRLVSIWGYDVRHAYDGVTGLALAAAFRPDVLLLGIIMPDMCGLEVAMQVRQQKRLKHCFIVAITGRTDAKHRQQCYENGIDLCLIKPIVPGDLQTLLLLELQHVRSRKSGKLQRPAVLTP
jgi:CheY-like chemotaxis protein